MPVLRAADKVVVLRGDAILNAVTDEGCDTIVMGAYGHSRLREMTFGGATRHVLRHMTVPTLLSH